MSHSSTHQAAALDPAFGQAGIIDQAFIQRQLSVPTVHAVGLCVVARDGLVFPVMLSEPGNPNPLPGLVKTDINGVIDPLFGGGKGYLIEDFPNRTLVETNQLYILSDQRILSICVFTKSLIEPFAPTLAVYSPEGTVDESFAGGRLYVFLPEVSRRRTLSPSTAWEASRLHRNSAAASNTISVAASSDSIVFAYTHGWDYEHSYVIKVTLQGQLDLGFAGTGYTEITDGRDFIDIWGLAEHQDAWVVVGRIRNEGVLARVLADGSMDTAFKDDGFVYITEGYAWLRSVYVTASEHIRVGGAIRPDAGSEDITGIVFGYTPNGEADPSFAPTRLAEKGFWFQFDQLESTAVDSLIWAQGRKINVQSSSYTRNALIGRFNPNGEPDEQFSDNGYWIVPGTDGILASIAVQADLKLILSDWFDGARQLRRYTV